MALLDSSWMPNCAMKRVICHWTAGQHQASALDREHYHILVQADGTLVRGNRSIEDNVSTRDGVYAAHTLNCNTGAIGVAACCMAGAVERPFRHGQSPMTREQWETMAEVVAELCRFYRIPVSPTTVLGHGEVEVHLGIRQRGKWDPLVLPWNPDLSRVEVGASFRALVQNELEGAHPTEEVRPVTVVVGGRPIERAFMTNGGAWAEAGTVASLLAWSVAAQDGEVRFSGADSPAAAVPAIELDGDTYVDVEDLAAALGRTVGWDPGSRTVSVG